MDRILGTIANFVSKRPRMAVGVVLVITFLSIFSVGYNGMNSEFNFENFMPEEEVAQANQEISNTFENTYGLELLARSEQGDVLTQGTFLDALRTERNVFHDQNISQYLVDPNRSSNSIVSPAYMVTSSMLLSMNQSALDMLNIDQVPTYDNLIKVMENVDTPRLKSTIHDLMSSPTTPDYIKTTLPRLLTSDFDPESQEPQAKGFISMVNFDKNKVATSDITRLQLERQLDSDIVNTAASGELYLIGEALINEDINQASDESIGMLFPIAMIAIVIILFMVYRNIADTLIGLLGLALAITWMYGFGTAMGYSFNPMTTVVPILILGLGIDYGIHLVMRYREERGDGEGIDPSIRTTVLSVGEALLLATITTMIAFLSNVTSSLQPIVEFGILNAVGILSSFVVMILLIPATKALRDRRRESKGRGTNDGTNHYTKKGVENSILHDINCHAARASKRRPGAVILVALLVTGGFAVGASQLDTTFDMNDFLPQELQSAQNIEFLAGEFNNTGDVSAQVLIKGEVTDPDAIRAWEESVQNMADDPYVLKKGEGPDVESFLQVMYDWGTNSSGQDYIDSDYNETFANMYQQFFDPQENQGTIRDQTTQANVTMLLQWIHDQGPGEMREDMVQYLIPDDGGYKALLQVSIANQLGSGEVWDLYDDLKADVQPLQDQGLSAVVTGETIMTEVIVSDLNSSQTTSFVTTLLASLIILTAVMWLYNRSYALGALAVLPISFCVVWMWGTMFLAGISLNVMTLMIASLTIGMGVTYGIHVTHRFVEEFNGNGDISTAVDKAVGNTGVSLFGAALTTVIGFGIIGFSILPPVQQFGVITAMAIGFSFIGAVYVLPSFLVLWARWKAKKG
ncbi:MAG: efflux RND transporter permease subunit [Methanomassiliicoccales archaeon]